MEKIRVYWQKYNEIIRYVFFGVLTTICNFIAYLICARIFRIDEITSTAIAFIISVVFAFFTNRKYVFNSKATGFKETASELMKFFGSRVFSGGLDMLIMYIFVTLLLFNDIMVKIFSNIIVVILNYIFSKIFVFKK